MSETGVTYKDAGVDIDAGNRAVALMKDAVSATHGPSVLAGVGAFGGLFSLQGLAHMTEPVLAASADGVGTKVRLAAQYHRFEGIGADLVNHCINDILVQGAHPLFFLDYVASAKLDPVEVATVVQGMANACKAAGCALLGGETAEMPGVYMDGELDVVGTIVGAVDRAAIIDGRTIAPGDVVVGLASASPHTNGYSLIRHVLGDRDLSQPVEALGGLAPIDQLLVPHRPYTADVKAIQNAGVTIKGLVHITGGGLIENPPRILADDVAIEFDRTGWAVPPLYRWLQALGKIPSEEMHRVFNMGIGMLVVVDQTQVEAVLESTPTMASVVGRVKARVDGPVEFSPSF